MAKFLMHGKYSAEALRNVSAERTDKAVNLIKALGGEILSMYVTLGADDLLLIVELPDIEAAVKASVELYEMSGVSFTTSPAVEVATFDEMMANL